MGLVDIAKKDSELINSDLNGWAVEQFWKSPANLEVTIKGRHVKHHLGINQEGSVVNTKTASVTFSEEQMIAVTYTIRNASGEVDLEGHKVSVNDSTGTLYKYMVKEWFPDEVLGMIVCILTAYE